MKRTLLVLLSLSICLSIICCGNSAPLEVTKASISEKLEFSLAPGSKSVLSPPSGHRFVVVEIKPKSESETKFKPDEVVLIDSGGKRFVPVAVAPFGEMGALKDFAGIVSGTVTIQSPEGASFTIGKDQKDAPTAFLMSGKDVSAALIYEVPTESSGFQLKVLDFSPITIKLE